MPVYTRGWTNGPRLERPEGRHRPPGRWVLTFDTGGVALFALQFAKLGGASVVALTSTGLA